MAGDQITGASTFRLEQGLDTGPVFGVVTDEIRPTDTAGDLLGRLAVSGAGLLVATLDGLEAGALVAGAAAGRRREPGAQDPRRGRPGGLDRSGDARRPARSAAARRRRGRGASSAASGSSSARCGPHPRSSTCRPARSGCTRTASGSARPRTRCSSARSRPRARSRWPRGLGPRRTSGAGRAPWLTTGPTRGASPPPVGVHPNLLGGRRAGPRGWIRPGWRPWTCSAPSSSTVRTRTSRGPGSWPITGSPGGTRDSPPSSATVRCAGVAGTTRSSRTAWTGAWTRSSPSCSTPCAWGCTSCTTCASATMPPSGRPSSWPARPSTRARRGSPTPSCGGSPVGAPRRTGSSTWSPPGRCPPLASDPVAHLSVATSHPGLDRRRHPRRAGHVETAAHLGRHPGRAPGGQHVGCGHAGRAHARSRRSWSAGSRSRECPPTTAPCRAWRSGSMPSTPRRSRRWPPARPGCRTRAARWWPSPWPTQRSTGPDARWLDMCAGPGGKAALLAGQVARAAGRSPPSSCTPIERDLVRASLRPVRGRHEVLVADATVDDIGTGYDRVLLDAPCTGLGALRRRPESRWRRSAEDLAELTALQRRLPGPRPRGGAPWRCWSCT